MLKYLKHFLPPFTAIMFMIIIAMGEYSPTLFLLGFSLLMIIGDYIMPRDKEIQYFSYPAILNFSLYINLPILLGLVLITMSFLTNNLSEWYVNILNTYIYHDFIEIRNSFNLIDKFCLIIQASLLMGILGVVAGHELTHRIKNKFDMFVGNWLLAFSWDCTFAIEHVYGHHKHACLPEDPASAQRGDNIYAFILKAIFNEHVDGWKIEINRVKKKGQNPFSLNNRMIVGYLRSLTITFLIFTIAGLIGVLYFLICAFITKSFLEAINYIEHYGLVRVRGSKVEMKHSWNSNHLLSSIFLYNVTRHSDHHRLAKLKFWELHPCPESAPMTPYGYLSMLYLVLITPLLYKKIMHKKLIDWDLNYANNEERELVNTRN
ncbi:MAG: hypothetical protein CMP56_01730 [Flavobacteriales bacterium]|nr:hypothetical protein [Flavobacteriales bacterium]